jgi:hypothetical protein
MLFAMIIHLDKKKPFLIMHHVSALILIFIMHSSDSYKAKSPLNIELVNG